MGCYIQCPSLSEQEVQAADGKPVVIAVRDGRRIFEDVGVDIVGYFRLFGIFKRGTATCLLVEGLDDHFVLEIPDNRIRSLVVVEELYFII